MTADEEVVRVVEGAHQAADWAREQMDSRAAVW
jgi:hypothetical protein